MIFFRGRPRGVARVARVARVGCEAAGASRRATRAWDESYGWADAVQLLLTYFAYGAGFRISCAAAEVDLKTLPHEAGFPMRCAAVERSKAVSQILPRGRGRRRPSFSSWIRVYPGRGRYKTLYVVDGYAAAEARTPSHAVSDRAPRPLLMTAAAPNPSRVRPPQDPQDAAPAPPEARCKI